MKKRAVLLAPVFVIAVGFLTALLFSSLLGVWAWVPLIAVYWALCLAIPVFLGKADVKSYFSRPTGIVLWPVLSLVVGLIPLPIFIFNLQIVTSPLLIALWIGFALINPFFEEIFWRGYLLEALPFNRKWLRAAYSTGLFVILHPLSFGVFSPANRNWMMLVSLVIMGAVWSAVRLKTKSLWWTVVSHILVDLFNLAVFVFLNLYTAGPSR
jgi:uncharacterized protein